MLGKSFSGRTSPDATARGNLRQLQACEPAGRLPALPVRGQRCAGTSQCSTAAARGLGASSVPLSLSQSVKKTSPRWRPRSITRRAEGTASLVSLAIVMASGIGWPAVRAASSHVESWRSGSASRSVIFTRPVWRPLRTVSDELLPPPPAAPELTGIMAQREVGVEHDPVHAVIGPVQQVPMPLGQVIGHPPTVPGSSRPVSRTARRATPSGRSPGRSVEP